MKPGIPWSVKGIGEDAREAAKLAARRAGMTLGEWLNTVILEQAESAPQAEEMRPLSPPREETSLKLENLAQELARLSRREQETAAARYVEQAPIADFERRFAANERQTMDALAAINERVAALSAQVASAPQMRLPERPEDVPGYLALENALRNVVDHIEGGEKRTREALRALQDRLTDVAHRAVQTGSDHLLQNAPVISRIESRLADVSARLDLAESMAARDLPGHLEGELSKLERRIEEVKLSSDAAVQRAQSAAAQAAQREARDIESRFQTMLRDAQASMRGTSSSDLQRVKSEIESLNQRIDDLKADSASERDVHQLRVAIEQLSARIAQGPDLRPLADMDRRLADLAERLERGAMTAAMPRLDELEARIGEIDVRVAEAQRSGGDQRAFEMLQQQIAGLSDRLGQTEQHLGHLATLERSIQQLYESIEQNRNWTQQIAEDAAARMADRVVQSLPQSAWQGGPSVELRALEEGLTAVRASAAQADQRTQETLEAVHDTLEQIVTKIADLEASDRAVAAAPPVAMPPPEPMQFAPPSPAQGWPQTPAYDNPPGTQAWSEQLVYTPQPEPMAQPAAYAPPMPETPAYAAPMPETPAYAAPISQQVPPVAETNAGFERDDFIAAARRAAQAAAVQQSVTPAAGANRFAQSKGLSFPKLELPFLRNRSKAKLEVPAPGPMAGLPKPTSNATRRRQWILVGLALLSIASVVSANYIFGNGGSKPAPAPVRIQSQPAPAEDAAPPAGNPPAPQSIAPEEQPGAKPPKPPPAELESGMPSPETLDLPAPGSTTAYVADGVLTGALPAGKADPSLSSLIAEVAADPGQMASNEPLPADIGSDSLKKAAMAGDAKAQFVIASRYLDGKETAQNFVESARWYQKSAAQGLAPAQYRLATLFERGRGVTQDITMARVWYERAAAKGNVKAMHNAAVIHSGSQGGTPDYEKAAQWFTSAARHGLKDSQYNLAVLYERGLGIQADPGEAMFWYSLAGQQDDKDAMAKAVKIAQSLPAEQARSIKARLKAWKAEPAVEEANVVAITDASWQPGAGKISLGEGFSFTPPASAASSELVSEVQSLLSDLGYNVGAADGKIGTRTTNAIRLFQMKVGLKVTGEITPELAIKLREAAG
jgi:localization factor PodJL